MKSSFSVSHVQAARYRPARLTSPLSMCAFISAYDDTGIVLRAAGILQNSFTFWRLRACSRSCRVHLLSDILPQKSAHDVRRWTGLGRSYRSPRRTQMSFFLEGYLVGETDMYIALGGRQTLVLPPRRASTSYPTMKRQKQYCMISTSPPRRLHPGTATIPAREQPPANTCTKRWRLSC